MPNILFRSFMSQSGLGGGGSWPTGGTPGAVFGAALGGGPLGGPPELVVLGADIMAAEVGGGGGPIGGGNG